MCLIAHRDSGANIPNAVIEHNRVFNPDGFGIAWRDSAGLHAEKFEPGEAGFGRFRALLKTIDKQPQIEYAAHWRKATHGAACLDLSHPFSYEDKREGEVLVFHNGIIDIDVPKGQSDTSHFVTDVLAKIEPRWWTKSATRFLVESAIGYSRLLLMTQRHSIRINESMWVKKDGIYYSTSPLPYTAKYAGTKSVSTWEPGTGRYFEDEWGVSGKDNDDLLIEVSPDDEAGISALLAPARGWYHMNHYVTPLREEMDDDGESYGTAACSVCKTTGEYYIIKGKVYIDVPHMGKDLVN